MYFVLIKVPIPSCNPHRTLHHIAVLQIKNLGNLRNLSKIQSSDGQSWNLVTLLFGFLFSLRHTRAGAPTWPKDVNVERLQKGWKDSDLLTAQVKAFEAILCRGQGPFHPLLWPLSLAEGRAAMKNCSSQAAKAAQCPGGEARASWKSLTAGETMQPG